MMAFSSIKLLGIRVDRVDWPAIEQFCQRALEGKTARQIVTVNGEFILTAQHNQPFATVINEADLVIPDSTNVVWFSRLKGRGLPMVTPGSELVIRLCRLAAESSQSVFLLGGRPGVAEKAAAQLTKQFPGLKIAGTSHANPELQGDSLPGRLPAVVQEIHRVRADIVLVAYGAPKQDLWIAQHKDATGAKLLIGVGGTFDMLAGTLPRAPKILRSLHLEWLWRLLLQPTRLPRSWRAVVVFPLRVLFGM